MDTYYNITIQVSPGSNHFFQINGTMRGGQRGHAYAPHLLSCYIVGGGREEGGGGGGGGWVRQQEVTKHSPLARKLLGL